MPLVPATLTGVLGLTAGGSLDKIVPLSEPDASESGKTRNQRVVYMIGSIIYMCGRTISTENIGVVV